MFPRLHAQATFAAEEKGFPKHSLRLCNKCLLPAQTEKNMGKISVCGIPYVLSCGKLGKSCIRQITDG